MQSDLIEEECSDDEADECSELDNDSVDDRPSTPTNEETGPTAPVTPCKERNANGKRQLEEVPVKYAASRRGPVLEEAKDTLTAWQYRTRLERYADASWTAQVLLPDDILKKIASDGTIRELSHFSKLNPPWVYANEHGEEVISLLTAIDEHFRQVRAREALEKRAKRKKDTEDKRKAEEAKKAVAEKQAAEFWGMIHRQMPAFATPQRAMPVPVLLPSSAPNMTSSSSMARFSGIIPMIPVPYPRPSYDFYTPVTPQSFYVSNNLGTPSSVHNIVGDQNTPIIQTSIDKSAPKGNTGKVYIYIITSSTMSLTIVHYRRRSLS